MNDEATTETWVVDHLADKLVVLVEDEGEIIVEVSADLLGDMAIEGAVLRVPLGEVGEPEWHRAIRDPDEERARRREAEDTIEELKKRDPGGDVAL